MAAFQMRPTAPHLVPHWPGSVASLRRLVRAAGAADTVHMHLGVRREMSTLITASSWVMSRPREATSVATSTEQLRLANWAST